MPKGEESPMTREEALSSAYRVANALSVMFEPLSTFGCGKNYYWQNAPPGMIAIMGFIIFLPRYTQELTAYFMVWAAAVLVHTSVAHFNHYFGRREITTFVGYPLITFLLPINVHFARRVLTPLMTFGIACVLPYPAVALLLKASAIGQVVVCGFMYSIKAADDDARGDAEAMARNR